MNKVTVAAFLLVLILVITATTWFLLNQTNQVKVAAFKVDSEGWKNLGGLLLTCSFNVSIHNMGLNDVEGLKLRVKMFVNGSEIDVKNHVLAVDEGLVNDTFRAGTVRSFRGEMQYSLHQGGAIDTIGGHPAGASYATQVLLGEAVLDERVSP
jgi:hypothetical protein